MHTKVDIGQASKSPPLLKKQLQDRIASRQKTSKAYTDVKRGAQVAKFKEGILVRVRKPLHVKKGLSKFHAPSRVIQKTGASSYVLEDGGTWNASHLSLLPERAQNTITSAAAAVPGPEPDLPRPTRVRKKPDCLNNYVH